MCIKGKGEKKGRGEVGRRNDVSSTFSQKKLFIIHGISNDVSKIGINYLIF